VIDIDLPAKPTADCTVSAQAKAIQRYRTHRNGRFLTDDYVVACNFRGFCNQLAEGRLSGWVGFVDWPCQIAITASKRASDWIVGFWGRMGACEITRFWPMNRRSGIMRNVWDGSTAYNFSQSRHLLRNEIAPGAPQFPINSFL
jgi:hypothetical protein